MLLRFDPFRDLDRITEPRRVPSMPMDAVRRSGTVVLHVDVPGVRREDIDITVERNQLTVTATRGIDESEGDEVIAAERMHGTFRRQFHLAETLDPNRLEAELDKGVLTLRVPVAETAQPRKIEIHDGGSEQSALTA